MKRYQECNVFVKILRRLRWQPIYFIQALYTVILYRFLPKKDRCFKSSLMFEIVYYTWQGKAKWYYTPEEIKPFFD